MDEEALHAVALVEEKPSIRLVGAGWKSISLVDVVDSVTFTVWLCGCNLKCPFCHNWKLANNDPDRCRLLDIERLLESLDSSRIMIDYAHFTGGEPLLQWAELSKLFEVIREGYSVKISLNSNLTLYSPLVKLLNRDLVDHVATDLKLPPEIMFGQDSNATKRLWQQFTKSIESIADRGIPLELRIPMAKFSKPELVADYVSKIYPHLAKIDKLIIVVQPLLGEPVTTPRNSEWCKIFCNPPDELLDKTAEALKKFGFNVRVKKWLSS
ncbi:anaerobic ribonucleoside-triphosphate reductase activating protein [Thermogladius sp. 4427co]|uniref:anaerobic ribonucleoside-triphosphate reductase activating protein n=1 Tax=Thermogladius sp. 4427co TaxID=3450718 RepID=UPI003F79C9C5